MFALFSFVKLCKFQLLNEYDRLNNEEDFDDNDNDENEEVNDNEDGQLSEDDESDDYCD